MTATNHTEHYVLSQFIDTDRPTFTGDYSGDMAKIDAAIYAASQSGGTDGLAAVTHDGTLTGDGTATDALSVIGSFTNATKAGESSGSKFDPNDYVTAGVYYVAVLRENSIIANIPTDLKNLFIRAALVVCKCGDGEGDIAQLWLNRSGGDGEPFVAYRIHNGAWGSWQRLAFVNDIPDVSALTSRIATLESKVSQLASVATQGANGFTATQLDTRHSADYDIVRVGTPTHSTESEESHHE